MSDYHSLTLDEISTSTDRDLLYMIVRSYTILPGFMCSTEQAKAAAKRLNEIDPNAIPFMRHKIAQKEGATE